MSLSRERGNPTVIGFVQQSLGVVYNTFPLPPAKDLSKLDPLAQAVLDARAAHPGATLATLYDPDLMPPNLRAAHAALDRAVDRLYRPSGFASDRERVEHLFALYEGMVAPLLMKPARKRRSGLAPAPADSAPAVNPSGAGPGRESP